MMEVKKKIEVIVVLENPTVKTKKNLFIAKGLLYLEESWSYPLKVLHAKYLPLKLYMYVYIYLCVCVCNILVTLHYNNKYFNTYSTFISSIISQNQADFHEVKFCHKHESVFAFYSSYMHMVVCVSSQN